MALLSSALLTILFCAVYLILIRVSPVLLNQPTRAKKPSIISLAWIIGVSVMAYLIRDSIPDLALGNRFLHAFGGGFLTFLLCFFVVRDTKIQITAFQFFVCSFLVVTALGVGNELLEFILQEITGYIFAPSPTDTWLDLISNTSGALIASVGLTPFLNRQQKTSQTTIAVVEQ